MIADFFADKIIKIQIKRGNKNEKAFALLIVLSIAVITACSGDYKSADIIVFSQKGCVYCEEAIEYINDEVKAKKPDVKLTVLDITIQKNMYILQDYMKKFKVRQPTISTPFIVVNQDTYFMGWTQRNKRKLLTALKLDTGLPKKIDQNSASLQAEPVDAPEVHEPE